ncbi:hypothetical protein E4U53_008096 [Claviceps sorghi]|nr:hypothetical protein E4U53_008096 [Claviceps sorghi]
MRRLPGVHPPRLHGLGPPPRMVVVPDLVELRAAAVQGADPAVRLVEARTPAADKGGGVAAEGVGQGGLDVGVGVGCGVGGVDACVEEPGEGGECFVPPDDGFEEVEEVLVGGWGGALWKL